MVKQTKLPYLQFYPSDWGGEDTLKFCSWEARYLWFEMVLICHKSPERGFLLKANGDPYTEDDLVEVISKATLERVRNCLFELETQGVFSRDRRKFIYSRKMVKGEVRAKNLEAKKSKSGDKSEIKSSKKGDKSDLGLPATNGNIKQISHSDDRTLVIPETRDQRLETKEERKKDSLVEKMTMGEPSPPEVQMAVSHYNQVAKEIGLPVVSKMNLSRTNALKARLKDCGGFSGWQKYLDMIRDAPFLLGQGERGWVADFDFLTKEKSFIKICEGHYHERKNGNGISTGRPSKSKLADDARDQALRDLGYYDQVGQDQADS